MSKLIDKNKDENGKLIYRFSRAPVMKKVKKDFEPNSESIARKELEYLKLRALARLFDIENGDPHMWISLALNLAQLRYPESKKLGRKLKWNAERRNILYFEVEGLLTPKGKGKSISQACNILAKKEPWITIMGGKIHQGATLKTQYYLAKDSQKN